MTTSLVRARLARGLVGLLACLHLTVTGAGPVLHASRGGIALPGSAALLALPDDATIPHEPRTCLACQILAGGAVPSVGPSLGPEAAAVEGVPLPAPRVARERPVFWRILQRPPPTPRG